MHHVKLTQRSQLNTRTTLKNNSTAVVVSDQSEVFDFHCPKLKDYTPTNSVAVEKIFVMSQLAGDIMQPPCISKNKVFSGDGKNRFCFPIY
jgi:hypothetical protein